jgi:hypothetical protein
MEVWDDDSGRFLDIGGERDLVDLVYGQYRNLAAGADFSKPKIYQKTVSKFTSCLE